MASWLDNTGLAYFWSKIKAKLEEITQRLDVLDPPYENLFVIETSSPGYLDASGVVQPQSSSGDTPTLERTSAFIPVESDRKYTIQVWYRSGVLSVSGWDCIQFFDSSNVFVGQAERGEFSGEHHTVTVDMANFQTAAYMRVSSRFIDPYLNAGSICKVMVEEGDTAHDYVPAEQDVFVADYEGSIGGGAYLTVKDRICVLDFSGTVDLSGSWTDVTVNAYIEERFRPGNRTVMAPVISQNNGGRCARLSVETDGSIHVTGMGGTAIGNQNVQGVLTWIC